ncbi:hypothetical protein Gogos_006095 [Gossypium gossypioides]|uniref:Uncharacterized protein n=1 Tax=Gossypium gossypioides TaxID=34282 RepID=A0A7J9C4J2_GOSGO|nr:hypothetical protein [Gossypium gossypioides]
MTTLLRKDGWRSFEISKMKMSNRELIGWYQMRFYIGAETSIGSFCLEFGEPSDIPLYSY